MDRLAKLLKKYNDRLRNDDRMYKITLQSKYYGDWCCVIDRDIVATSYYSDVEWDADTIGTGSTAEEALVDALKNHGIKNPNVR